MRLMRPIFTEEGCLKCHAAQGYEVGDVRGGISISIPMEPILVIARGQTTALVLGHSLLWIMGLGGISLGAQKLKQRFRERKQVEEALRAANQQLHANGQQLRAANQQLIASEQQFKAANQQLEASGQQLRASEKELRKMNHNMGERIKELNCLYGLSVLIEQRDITLEEIFGGLLELIPPGWHYPEITSARVVFGDREFKTSNFEKTKWKQSADIKVSGRKAGAVEVYYLKECPILDEGPFLKEERKLIDGISRALGEAIQRRQAEEVLQATNQQLQASEQQLRAANQQLIASEQQLRAANQQLQAEIAEHKRAEERIQASLKEKEVLIKEIHHRVKNNMQVISSILNLQSKQIQDEQTLKMFKNGQSRIRSMALVHEKLYEAEDLARIDFAEYIRSMVNDLYRLHGTREAIGLNIDIKDIFLDITTAIPCGLIINELVSNALKYAFRGDREGEIRIGLYSDKDGEFSLVVKDNGIGFPKDLDFRKTETLGMQLVILLVEQLEGAIELERKEGTAFTISFEKPKSMDMETIK
ncbi:histidine kinase dimerization/phosphoacceptor domain -containing protein, partial [Planctomycetota bacterium]